MAKLITSLIYDSMEDFPGCASYEGDYLRWHFGGFENAKYTLYRSGSSYCCEISIPKIKYYTTAAQEKKLTTDLKRVLASLDLDGKSEFEKAKRIYVYITSHVTYDYANLYNDSTGKYTAYNALEKGTAVCQGYASLLYRMMRMSGISCRFISGDGGGVRHGWNIVKIGFSYYNLDSTWDAGHDASSFLYFLKSNKDFYGHTRDDRFKTSTFNTTYPMSKTSYKLTGTHKHTWSWVVTQAATIFKTGTKTKTCTVCGATGGTKTIAKKTASVTLNASSSTMQAGQRSTAIQIAKQASADSVSKWTLFRSFGGICQPQNRQAGGQEKRLCHHHSYHEERCQSLCPDQSTEKDSKDHFHSFQEKESHPDCGYQAEAGPNPCSCHRQ